MSLLTPSLGLSFSCLSPSLVSLLSTAAKKKAASIERKCEIEWWAHALCLAVEKISVTITRYALIILNSYHETWHGNFTTSTWILGYQTDVPFDASTVFACCLYLRLRLLFALFSVFTKSPASAILLKRIAPVYCMNVPSFVPCHSVEAKPIHRILIGSEDAFAMYVRLCTS